MCEGYNMSHYRKHLHQLFVHHLILETLVMGENRINASVYIPSKCTDRVVRKKVIGVTQTNLSAVCFIANILRRIGYYFFLFTLSHTRLTHICSCFNLTDDDDSCCINVNVKIAFGCLFMQYYNLKNFCLFLYVH